MRVREHIRRNWNLRFPVFRGMVVLLIATILITLTNADAIAFADISSTFAADVSGADRSKNRDPSAQLSADIAQQPGSGLLKIEWKKSYKPIGDVKQADVIADPFKVSDGFVIGLYIYGDQETFLASELLKIDFEGNVTWQHASPCQDIDHVVEYRNGYILTCTESTGFPKDERSILSLDKQGKVVGDTKLDDERFYEAFPAAVDGSIVTYVTPPKYCMKNTCRGVRGALEIKDNGVVVKEKMGVFLEFTVPSSIIQDVDLISSWIFLNHVDDGWLVTAIIRDSRDHGKDLSFPGVKISGPLFFARKFDGNGLPRWSAEYVMPMISGLNRLIAETDQRYVVFTHVSEPNERKVVNGKVEWKSGVSSGWLVSIDKKRGRLGLRQYSVPPLMPYPRMRVEGGMVASVSAVANDNDAPSSIAMFGPSGEIVWEQRIDAPIYRVSNIDSVFAASKKVFLFGSESVGSFVVTRLSGLE
jgi:hypothetical protein